jgi:predicted lipoprotein with Yx(FWY)xxD motif
MTRKSTKLLLLGLGASALLAACGSSSSGNSASSNTASQAAASQGGSVTLVKTASSSALGKTVLVDAQGMTLYALSGEHAGKFICTSSACVGVWHPLTVAAGSTPSGTVTSLSTLKRPDGTVQVTYKGMPLYSFAQDQSPGQASGQGIKDVGTWSAVAVSGSEGPTITSTSAAATTSAAEGSGGGYGY